MISELGKPNHRLNDEGERDEIDLWLFYNHHRNNPTDDQLTDCVDGAAEIRHGSCLTMSCPNIQINDVINPVLNRCWLDLCWMELFHLWVQLMTV